jgi:hypothetical protein
MAKQFETLKTVKTDPAEVKRIVAALGGSGRVPALDPEKGQAFEIGSRRWTFVLTEEASGGWDRIGREPVVVGVLAHQFPALDEPHAQRVLVALPGKGGAVTLEMRDAEGAVLWTGKGTITKGQLEFSMPISRPGVRARGTVAGRISGDGAITLAKGQLPRPKAKAPSIESVE